MKPVPASILLAACCLAPAIAADSAALNLVLNPAVIQTDHAARGKPVRLANPYLQTEPTDQAVRVANDAGHSSPPQATADPAPTESTAGSGELYDEAYRPQFHFTYKKGWLSDIKGLYFYDGEYGYAAQTFSDIPATDGRRIQIAWLSTHVDRGHTGSSIDANRLDETTHHLWRVTSTESGLRSVSADRE